MDPDLLWSDMVRYCPDFILVEVRSEERAERIDEQLRETHQIIECPTPLSRTPVTERCAEISALVDAGIGPLRACAA